MLCLCMSAILAAQSPTPKSLIPLFRLDSTLRNAWGDSVSHVMQNKADSVFIYHLSLRKDSSHFTGYVVLESKMLTAKQSADFRTIFCQKSSYKFSQAVKKCDFEPAVAFRFYYQNKTVDILCDMNCYVLKINSSLDFDPSSKKIRSMIKAVMPNGLKARASQAVIVTF